MRSPLAAALLSFVSLACGKSAATDPLAPNAVTTMTGAHEGQTISLRGRVSTEPDQHIMAGVQDKQQVYFDLGKDEQTVLYWKDAPACAGEIVVTGKVIAVRGHSKGSKGDDHAIEELHVDVESARCLE